MKSSKSSLNPQGATLPERVDEQITGYLLSEDEGENLIHFRDHGKISIKVDAVRGSNRLTLATQQVMKGSGIPTHRHLDMDEVFYVLKGSGVFSLNDGPCSFQEGTTIFIPQNTWHSFQNDDEELLLLWAVAPAGLDSFFRDTCSREGEPPKDMTAEEIRTIALRYGTEFR